MEPFPTITYVPIPADLVSRLMRPMRTGTDIVDAVCEAIQFAVDNDYIAPDA